MMNMLPHQLFEAPSSFRAASYQPSWREPATATVVYFLLIPLLKALKVNPKSKVLTAIAVLHNCLMITISVVSAIGSTLALKERYDKEGFQGIFCSQHKKGTVLDGSAGYWLMAYYLTKYVELIDTFLLAVKNKPIIFLHGWHHTSMMWICWTWLQGDWLEGSLWCAIVNSVIHFFMYTYYLLAALGSSIWWKKYLTSLQIVQFVTGTCYVNIFLYRHYFNEGCGDQKRIYAAWIAHIVNFSFICLFSMFFKKNYSKKRDVKPSSKKRD